jgi:hypothetical protein
MGFSVAERRRLKFRRSVDRDSQSMSNVANVRICPSDQDFNVVSVSSRHCAWSSFWIAWKRV